MELVLKTNVLLLKLLYLLLKRVGRCNIPDFLTFGEV